MIKTFNTLLTVTALVLMTHVTPAAVAEVPAMRFGVDIGSVRQFESHGVQLSYGVLWVGSWIQKYGWAAVEAKLVEARRLGVTPVINWWYWGDDISPACVEHGCDDALQHVHKDKATWFRLSHELADLIARVNPGSGAIVVLEIEFNKHGIETYEPFDQLMVEQAQMFHQHPNVSVAIGFGNWGREHWGRFARTVAACDVLGTELLQSSVRNAATYLKSVDTLVDGAQELQRRFHKPSLVIDLALSSYPEPAYAANQAAVIKELFARMPELKAANVQGLIWRQLNDDPAFDISNYHGVAERSWGLLHPDGTPKPAFQLFLDGIRAQATHS